MGGCKLLAYCAIVRASLYNANTCVLLHYLYNALPSKPPNWLPGPLDQFMDCLKRGYNPYPPPSCVPFLEAPLRHFPHPSNKPEQSPPLQWQEVPSLSTPSLSLSYQPNPHHRLVVKTQTRPNPPPDYPLAPQNRTATTTATGSGTNKAAGVVKKSAQKSKVKISKALFKRHVEKVTSGVMADLKGQVEGEDGEMMKWEEGALELLRGVVEGFLESGGRGGGV